MAWFFQLLPLAVFVIVVISIVRTVMRLAGRMEQPSRTPTLPGDFDPEAAARTRRIQEEIRRKIAERRGELVAPETSLAESEPESPSPTTPAMLREEPPLMDNMAAVMERQRELADQMRALEAARVREQRLASVATATVQAETDRAASVVATREGLFADLRNPQTLRQVIVLREVLGTPVGLR